MAPFPPLPEVTEETLYPEADFLMDLHGGDVNEALTPLGFSFPPRLRKSFRRSFGSRGKPLRSLTGLHPPPETDSTVWAAQCGIPAL